jgi:DNA-binding transcriptional ArsR family regulator
MKKTTPTRPPAAIPQLCCTLAITGAEQDRFVDMLRAAGSPIRFETLKFLVTHPGCITGDVVKALPIAQATVSQHLKRLRQAGWIDAHPEGPATCYDLNAENVAWFRRWVEEIF